MNYVQATKAHVWLADESYNCPDFLSILENIDEHLANANISYKNALNDTTTVGLVTQGNYKLVIKRYNFRNFGHALKLQFRKSHAFRSFEYASLLPSLGIKTVKPVALIQKKMAFIKRTSYFVSQYEEGIRGCKYFHNEFMDKSHWFNVAAAILEITHKLKRNRLYHGDYHFGNFVIVNHEPHLLDFDAMKIIHNEKKYPHYHQKDLNNFQRYLKRNTQAARLFKKLNFPI